MGLARHGIYVLTSVRIAAGGQIFILKQSKVDSARFAIEDRTEWIAPVLHLGPLS